MTRPTKLSSDPHDWNPQSGLPPRLCSLSLFVLAGKVVRALLQHRAWP